MIRLFLNKMFYHFFIFILCIFICPYGYYIWDIINPDISYNIFKAKYGAKIIYQEKDTVEQAEEIDVTAIFADPLDPDSSLTEVDFTFVKGKLCSYSIRYKKQDTAYVKERFYDILGLSDRKSLKWSTRYWERERYDFILRDVAKGLLFTCRIKPPKPKPSRGRFRTGYAGGKFSLKKDTVPKKEQKKVMALVALPRKTRKPRDRFTIHTDARFYALRTYLGGRNHDTLKAIIGEFKEDIQTLMIKGAKGVQKDAADVFVRFNIDKTGYVVTCELLGSDLKDDKINQAVINKVHDLVFYECPFCHTASIICKFTYWLR